MALFEIGQESDLFGKQGALDAVQPTPALSAEFFRRDVVRGLNVTKINFFLMTLVQDLIERANGPPEIRADEHRTRLRAAFIHRVIPRLVHNIW